MRKFLSVILSVLVVSVAAHATPITVFDTGTASPGVLLPEGSVDMHYALVSTNNGFPAPGPAYVGMNQNTLPYIHEDGVSRWIEPTPDATADLPAGLYTYATGFVLPVDFSGATLSGQWLSDNEASMYLNGNLVSMTPNNNNSFQAWTPFSISSGFQAGLNTLTFGVTNDLVGPTALRVEFFNASFTSVPDSGSTLGLLIAALSGLFGLSRLRYFWRT